MSKIIGNTTTTPVPRSDWSQTDKTKADFIRHKPELGAISEKDIIEKSDLTADVQLSLKQIDTKANILPITTEEYEALNEDDFDANTLYMLTDAEEDTEGAVLYTEQTLAEEQKTQARENIGAVSAEEVEAMINGDSGNNFSETGDVVELELEADIGLEVISKIHRDETWGLSDKLVLHQVSGSNFVDLTSYFGGVGAVYSQNGLTATINADSTATISGTNESSGYTNILTKSYWSGEYSEKVYPAGTYTIPSGFTMNIRAAQYPSNVAITGASGNLKRTVTIPEPFRIVSMFYAVGGNVTTDVIVPLGLFRGSAIPETGYEYSGNIHTVTFDNPIYEGEFNWRTGELKDADGNTVGYYDAPEIKSLSGTNHFWTCFGENTVSNAPEDLGKVILRLNETAPEETVPSICDFTLTPTTPEAAYGLYRDLFLPNGQFFGNEVPVLTTKGNLFVKDVDGNVKYSKYIEPIFNSRGVADVLTHRGLEKKWSKKFYLNKEPISITSSTSSDSNAPAPYIFVWEFDETEFINTGIPAKIHDIPMASPCFINNDSSESKVQTQVLYNSTPYPAFFSYNAETEKYTLTVRGIQGSSINNQLTHYSKVHFYYQLETPYNIPFAFAMGIDAGDQISFEADLVDNQPYIDAISGFKDRSVNPTITAFVPRNVKDAMDGMNNAARMLNMDDATGGDATVQGYSWIGEGDGVTDYTVQIQGKLDELHTVSKGGTIHLGPGTYPISKSLIVYSNTQIIGDGHTIIEQRADNTHAIIWNGSNIRMCDLTIKLVGACTELTACIFANSNNVSGGKMDERYPVNTYVQFCSTSNVTLIGTYSFARDNEGCLYLSDEVLSYRGVGIYGDKLYFNFYDSKLLTCRHLYSAVYGGGGSNNYQMYVIESRYGVYGGGSNNMFDIQGHTYHDNDGRGGQAIGTDYMFYGYNADSNTINFAYYDTQYSKGIAYFAPTCQRNHYTLFPTSGGLSNTPSSDEYGHTFGRIIDYGRGNIEVQPSKEKFVGMGGALFTLSQLPYWNTKFNPSIHNALSGAGVWGNITSNKEWDNPNGDGLSNICQYPKDTNHRHFGLSSVICKTPPSEDSPIEIVIDISDRPVTTLAGCWVQFDHRYVAEDFTVSIDTTNDGVFNYNIANIIGNTDPINYKFILQEPQIMVYRIKIGITKALQIPELVYTDAASASHTVNYNPNGYIGIVNIGMPSGEAYGRAFLGECGGSLYGNVDMHNNTLKNLPTPVDDGDAVSKAYLNDSIVNKVDKIAGATGNALAFGDDGTIVDSGKTTPSLYVVPYYDSTSMTDAQKAEIVNVIDEIKADTGSYAVFIKPGNNNRVFHATCELSNRNTIITAVDHDESTSFKYNIKVTSAGAVTATKSNFFADNLDTASPMQAATVSYVADYVGAEIANSYYVFRYDPNSTTSNPNTEYDEYNRSLYERLKVDLANNKAVCAFIDDGSSVIPSEIDKTNMANGVINLYSMTSFSLSDYYQIVFTNDTITYSLNPLLNRGQFDETSNRPASQSTIANWVKYYVEQTIANGAW